MYADDTHLTYASDNVDNIQLHLNQDLENVHNWLRANKLTLNMTKTEFMLIGSRQRLSTLTESPTFAINDFEVSQVTTAKSLGVTIRTTANIVKSLHIVTKNLQIRLKMSGQVACILRLAAVLFQLLCACTILVVLLAGGGGGHRAC